MTSINQNMSESELVWLGWYSGVLREHQTHPLGLQPADLVALVHHSRLRGASLSNRFRCSGWAYGTVSDVPASAGHVLNSNQIKSEAVANSCRCDLVVFDLIWSVNILNLYVQDV